MLPGMILLIVVFALVVSRTVFISRRDKVKVALSRVKEALWARHAKMPRLLSLVTSKDASLKDVFAKLLALRDQLSDEHLPMGERMNLEKNMTLLIDQVVGFGQADASDSKSPSFISLLKELSEAKLSIEIAVTSYNTECENFTLSTKAPWLKMWSTVLQKHAFEQLSGV